MSTPMPAPVGPQPPRPTGSSRTPLVIAIAVTAVLLAGVGAAALVLVLGGSSDGSSDGSSPEAAVRDYIDAVNEGDCEAIAVHPGSDFDSAGDCEDFRDEAERRDEDDTEVDVDLDSFEILDLDVTSESAEDAVVRVETTVDLIIDGEPTPSSGTTDYTVSKQDDRWLVDEVTPLFGEETEDEGSSDGESEDPASSSQTPEDAIRELAEAATAEDCAVLVEHPVTGMASVAECEEMFDLLDESADPPFIEVIAVEVVSETEDEATVVVDLEQSVGADGEPFENTLEYELEKDGDRWLVTAEHAVTDAG